MVSERRTFIKFCGIRTLADINKAIALDIDALGFICVPNRKRTVEEAELEKIIRFVPDGFLTVGVLMNPTVEIVEHWLSIASFSAIQLHGDESPQLCQQLKERFPKTQMIKVFHIEPTTDHFHIEPYFPWIDVALFDASFSGQRGGTGRRFDWTKIPSFAAICRRAKLPFWVAGGIDPSNVSQLVKTYHPDGIDVSSGIEQNGVKDQEQMKELVEKVRQIDNSVC